MVRNKDRFQGKTKWAKTGEAIDIFVDKSYQKKQHATVLGYAQQAAADVTVYMEILDLDQRSNRS